MKDRLLSTLGICRKAGKLVMGFDVVVEADRAGEVALILLAEDLSAKSGKEMMFMASKQNTEVVRVPIPMDEIRRWLGKRSGIIGITDPGLAQTIRTYLPQLHTGQAGEED